MDIVSHQTRQTMIAVVCVAKVVHTPHLAASTTEAQIAVAQEAAQLIGTCLEIFLFRCFT